MNEDGFPTLWRGGMGGSGDVRSTSCQHNVFSYLMPFLITSSDVKLAQPLIPIRQLGPTPNQRKQNILVHFIFHSHYYFWLKTVELESWTPETGPRFSEQTGAQPETGKEVSHLGIGMLQYDKTQSIGRLSFPCAIAGDGGRGSPPLLPPHALGKQEPGSSHFVKGLSTAFVPHWRWVLRAAGKMYLWA